MIGNGNNIAVVGKQRAVRTFREGCVALLHNDCRGDFAFMQPFFDILQIRENGNASVFEIIGIDAFRNLNQGYEIESVKFPDTVTEIQDYALQFNDINSVKRRQIGRASCRERV